MNERRNSVTTPPGPARPPQRHARADEDSGEDGSQHKRQRTALACDSCRSRKSRCDGARPLCTACAAMGFSCVYRRPVAPSALEPAPPDHSRVTQMESRLQMVETLLQQLSRATDGRRLPGADVANAASTVDFHLLIAESDSVDGMGTITFAGEAVSHYFGPSSNSAFAAQVSRAVKATHRGLTADQGLVASMQPNHADDHLDPTAMTNGRGRGALSTTMLSRPASPPGLSRLQPRKASDLLHLPAAEEMLRLVQAYFAHAGGYFPFVDKASLIRSIRELGSTGPSEVLRRPRLCLLNAVLACGMSLTLPDSQDVKGDEAKAAIYCERALALSPWLVSNTANLETVQGLAVLTQYAEGTSCSAQTWKLHGLLMQAAFNIGLHVEDASTTPDMTPLEREMRRRTWYMCLVLDRMLSSTLGRPPLLHESVALVPSPSEGEILDHTSPSQPLSQVMGQSTSFCKLFVESIQLFRLLGEVILKLYHDNRASNQHLSMERLLTTIIELDIRLHDWQNHLSPDLRMVRAVGSNGFPEGRFDDAGGVLTLRFQSAQLLLYRVVLSEYLHHVANGTRPDQPASVDAICHTYITLCAELAKEMIDLIAEAQGIGAPLPSWWFVLYYLFQAALVLFGTAVFAKSDIAKPGLCQFDIVAQLQKAAQTVEYVAKHTTLAKRCSKYLAAIIQVVQALQDNEYISEANGLADDAVADFSQTFPGNHAAFGNLSNFDVDGGLFLGDSNLDFLNYLGTASGVENTNYQLPGL